MADSESGADAFSLMPFIASVVALGDRRLDERVLEMVGQCLTSAKASLPAMFGKEGEKAAQRFLSNPRVEIGALRAVLYSCSIENIRRRAVKSVVSIYDPTLLDFSFQNWKSGRMPIGDHRGLGYQWLNALLVEAAGGRVLGVGHQVLVSSSGLDDELDYVANVRKKKWRDKQRRNHPNQFLVIANEVDRLLPEDIEVIHVADREFDDGLVLRSRAQARPLSHFIIRGNDTRMVQVRDPFWLPAELRHQRGQKELDKNPEHLTNVYLSDIVHHLPCHGWQTLQLDARGRVCRNAENAARTARLQVGAVPIRLARKSKRAEQAGLPEVPIWLNLVVVRETPSREGTRPILWLLLTDLPVATPEELDRVVHLYSRRWRTEEFFRTEKDAMQAEASELDDPHSTARLLVFLTFKAMFLDELRFRADIPAGVPLTKKQRQSLEAGAKRAKALELSRRERGTEIPELPLLERSIMALGLIAELGAWTGKSLGNYVLLRGLPVFVHDVAEGRYAWLLEEDVG
jgi:Transposase DNA-binding